MSKEVLDGWRWKGEKKKGGQRVYSDLAIEVCLTVRKVYDLGYRQTEGFMESFFGSLKVSLPVPDYSVICRRSATVFIALPTKGPGTITDIVVDATGLKVYGEGEWKVRKHGWGKHRTWMKLHVALDAALQQAGAVELTTNAVEDAALVEPLLKAVKATIRSFTGDGAYDKAKAREYLHQKAAEQGEDIQKSASQHSGVLFWTKKGRAYFKKRNDDIKAMRRLVRKQWKVLANYHQRSKVETFMFRYKTILGGTLRARKTDQQKTEVKVGCKIINQMLTIAKPISEKVA